MKKIIKNRVYNTESADLIGHYATSCSVIDFRYYEESLYRKHNGEYFIHGSGGPASPYRVAEYGGYSGGERIVPMAADDAREWAEDHLTAYAFESVFGLPTEGADNVNVSFSLDARAYELLRRESVASNKKYAAVVQDLILAAYDK